MKQVKNALKGITRFFLTAWYGIPLSLLALAGKFSGKRANVGQSTVFNFAVTFAKLFSRFSRYYCTIEFLPKFADDVVSCDDLKTDTQENEYALVIQGPILNGFTAESIRIYRKIFPKAFIIVSTWKGTDGKLADELRGLADEVILNDPPENSGVLNVNYQAKSSYAGMKRACELGIPYAAKLRSDFRVYTPMMFEYLKSLLEIFPVDESVRPQQKERIITVSGASVTHPYWLADNFFFGASEDLMKFFDFPPDTRTFSGRTTPEWGDYIRTSKKWRHSANSRASRISRPPEVYMTKSYIQRTSPAGYDSSVKSFWEDMRKRFLVISSLSTYLDKYDGRYAKYNKTAKYGAFKSGIDLPFSSILTLPLLRGHLLYDESLEKPSREMIELFPALGDFCKGREHIDEVLKDLPLLKGDGHH